MGKPLFISEFGCEALYGQHGDENMASSWSEEYQAKLFRDNLRMFDNIPNLCGVSPWVLFDFVVLPACILQTRTGGTARDWSPTRDSVSRLGTSCTTITVRKSGRQKL